MLNRALRNKINENRAKAEVSMQATGATRANQSHTARPHDHVTHMGVW